MTGILRWSMACALASTAWGQQSSGRLTGRLTDPDGGPVRDAQVQAKDASSGVIVRASSNASGDYTMPDLPPGLYDISVPLPCCLLRRPDRGHLEIEIIMDDPGAFTGVWRRTTAATLAPPHEDIMEFVCNENNRDALHLTGK